jgi:ATP-dependent protease ClpP protease subunit
MKRWFEIQNRGGKRAEIRIRGIIGLSNKDSDGWFGPVEGQGGTVREFEDELIALGDIAELDLYVSSEGGLVSDGLAIHNILSRHPAHVTAHIDGYAFSIASVIVMAASEVRMPANALLMIHNASTFAGGDYRDFEREVEALKAHNLAIARAYAAKAGNAPEDWLALMDATTYMDGARAQELGLADVVEAEMALSACGKPHRFFNTAPAEWRRAFDKPAPSTPKPHTTSNMKDQLISAAKARNIALNGDETEEQIIALLGRPDEPAASGAVLNLDDGETRKVFDTAVSAAVSAALPAQIENAVKPLKDEIARLAALHTNGASASAQGAAPVTNAASAQAAKKELTRAEYNNLSAADRLAFVKDKGRITD